MTVRTRRFRPFEGTPTSTLARLLVLPRYAWKEAFSSKLVVGAFALSLVVPAGALVLVWLKHNLAALAQTPFAGGIPIPIDGRFFGWLLLTQTYFAFGLALLVAELAEGGNDLEGGFIFGFVGLAMLACFAIIRVARKNEPANGTDAGQPTTPPLPPKP